MQGRTNAGGTGGFGLNLKIIGSEEMPSNPRENTIWIKTSVKITSYAIQSEAPESPTEGLLWLKNTTVLSATTGAEINVGKKNTLNIRLGDAKLYTGGKWTAVDGWVYSNGEWVRFAYNIIIIYRNGVTNTEFCGDLRSYVASSSAASVKKNATNIVTTATYRQDVNTSAFVYTANKINLTSFNTITVNEDWITSKNNGAAIIHISSKIENNGEATSNCVAVAKNTNQLDVSSLSGEYYICVGCKAYGNSGAKVVCTIKEITIQ